jgi:hypothetical protein
MGADDRFSPSVIRQATNNDGLPHVPTLRLGGG